MSCSRAAIINISSILGSIEVAEAWEERQDICYRCSKVPPLGGWGGIWRSPPLGFSPPLAPALPDHDGKEGNLSSQAALNMLTKCLALEYGSSGILCVSVDPGHVTPPLEPGMVSDGRCMAILAQQGPTGVHSWGHPFPGASLPKASPSYEHPSSGSSFHKETPC